MSRRYRTRKGSVAEAVVKGAAVAMDSGAPALLAVIGTLLLIRCVMMRG